MRRKPLKLPNLNDIGDTPEGALAWLAAARALRIMPDPFDCYRLVMSDDRHGLVRRAIWKLREDLGLPDPVPDPGNVII